MILLYTTKFEIVECYFSHFIVECYFSHSMVYNKITKTRGNRQAVVKRVKKANFEIIFAILVFLLKIEQIKREKYSEENHKKRA